MKIRTGLVSNSSSSSFMLSTNNNTLKKVTVSIDIDISKYADYTISTMEELEEWVNEYYCCTLKEALEDEDCYKVQNVIDEIKKGRIVYSGSFSDDTGDSIETMLCYTDLNELDLPKDVKVIQTESR